MPAEVLAVSGRPLPLALKNRVLGLMAGSHRENVSEKQVFFFFFSVLVACVCRWGVCTPVYVLLHVGPCTCVCSTCWCVHMCMFSSMLVHTCVYVLLHVGACTCVCSVCWCVHCVCSPGCWCLHVCMFSWALVCARVYVLCMLVRACVWLAEIGLGQLSLLFSTLFIEAVSLSLSDLAHQFTSFD